MLVELKNISYGYGTDAVIQDVNLQINSGDFIGMIGPNGGGKSTIIKLIMGLIKPWTGSVNLGMRDSNQGLQIGYLPQYHDFDKSFPISIKELIRSGLIGKMKSGHHKKQTKMLVEEALQAVGLNDFKDRTIGQLSGGQMQRAFLGRAMVGKPDILILDEPVTYVDSSFEQEMYQLLEQINSQTAILLVSHDLGQISSMVKTIACVNGSLHYHPSNKISDQILASYDCPIELISHGKVPHRVLHNH